MTVAGLQQFFYDRLRETFDPREIRNLFCMVVEEVLGMDRVRVLAEPDTRVSEDDMSRIIEMIRRLLLHEPVQYVLGYTWFYGLRIRVNPAVLIPRPETEELVRMVLEYCAGRHDHHGPVILDAGCGSGCIALALAANLGGGQVSGFDNSEAAVKTASDNGSALGLNVSFYHRDLFSQESLCPPGTIDILVSNPPYVRLLEKERMKPNVLLYEPGRALFVPDGDPLVFYRQLALLGKKLLRQGGKIFLEINESLAGETKRLYEAHGYHDVLIHTDMQGKDRFLEAVCLYSGGL